MYMLVYIVDGGGTDRTLLRVAGGMTALEYSDVVALLGNGDVVDGGDVDCTIVPLYTVELVF